MELHKTTAANSQHVLTQDLDHILVHVMKDTLEMEKSVKVSKSHKKL